jgi:hypothetical protein
MCDLAPNKDATPRDGKIFFRFSSNKASAAEVVAMPRAALAGAHPAARLKFFGVGHNLPRGLKLAR